MNEGSKLPVMIHIYLKDTKDFTWLSKAGREAVGAIRVDSVEQLLEHIAAGEERA